MKNKKGFTLVEIIGVIVIIGIIALVAVPSFISSLNVFREDYYENVVKTLENSGQEFFTDNKMYRPSKIFEARHVNLSTLETEKYIDNIVDYEGNNCNNDSYVIIVRRGKNDYEYAVCLKCEADDFSTTDNKYCDPAWLDSTKIGYGLGEIPTIYVYKGTSREELKEKLKVVAWIIKYNNAGEEIDRVDGSGIEDVPEIYPTNLDTVDTNTPGEYKVTYEFNDKTEEGKVVVYENSAPSIIIKKENIVKSGNATESESATQVTDYISGEWGQKVIITLSAADNNYDHSETNVTKFQWKIDNKWLDLCESSDGRTCTATITDEMNEEGIHFRAVDNEGNISLVTDDPMTIRIDNTRPTCELSKTGNLGDNSWYVGDVTVTFNSSKTKDIVKDTPEAVSGITKRIITLESISGSDTAVQMADTASVTWYGYVEDRAQNYTICEINFKKDATAPTCTNSGDNTTWTNNGVTINYGCSDNLSSCNPSHSGGSKLFNTTTKTTSISAYTIKDNAGNATQCDARTADVYVDTTAPTCTDSGDNTTWTNSNVTIHYGCSDADSGCDPNNDGGSKVFSVSTKTSSISAYTIKDNAGNTTSCATRTADVYVDKDNPTCNVSVTSGTEGTNGWYKSASVTVSSSFGDSGGSGVSSKGTTTSSSASYNGDTTYTISSNTTGTTINCFVKDSAGNTGSNSITVKKDDGDGSNSCTATISNSAWAPNGPKIVTVTFTKPPISGCNSWSNTGASLGGDCSLSSQMTPSAGEVWTTRAVGISATTKSGVSVSCSTTVAVNIDREMPTISCTKSNTGTTSGVTVNCECGDGSGSGIASCPTTNTGVKSTNTYTVTDVAGNTASTTVSVSSQTQKRTKSCSTCKGCEDAGSSWSWGNMTTTNITRSCTTTFPLTEGDVRYELIITSNGGANGCNFSVRKYTKVWTYNKSCSTCGCDTWGDFGDWSDASSCSSGESSDHQTTTGCRTLYY